MNAPTKLPQPLKVSFGYVVWDGTVINATEDGAFVWDQYGDAMAKCQKETAQRPCRVQVIFCD